MDNFLIINKLKSKRLNLSTMESCTSGLLCSALTDIEGASSMAIATKNNCSSNIGIGFTGSVSNIDENNKDSVIGEVYFAIAINDKIYNKYF